VKIYLADFKKEQGNTINYHFLVSSGNIDLQDEDFSLKELIAFNVAVIFTENALTLMGNFKTKVELPCSRCLESFILHLEGDIQEKFKELSSIEEQEEVILEEQLPEEFLNGEPFNLDSILRDNLILTLPLKPLCSEECRGLCPVCGENLNVNTCNCEKEVIDPRLEDLKKFFEK